MPLRALIPLMGKAWFLLNSTYDSKQVNQQKLNPENIETGLPWQGTCLIKVPEENLTFSCLVLHGDFSNICDCGVRSPWLTHSHSWSPGLSSDLRYLLPYASSRQGVIFYSWCGTGPSCPNLCDFTLDNWNLIHLKVPWRPPRCFIWLLSCY